uniref:Reverse transcriptase domain-containing protein n=1 Tax=Amphimedon queenslandica TaxID=400682 RepID=A0A1X7VX24_AMPQE
MMLQHGVIKTLSSPWASPIVLVSKRDGIGFCAEYQRFNTIMKTLAFPLPRIDACVDSLDENQFFLTLDLMFGYWQVEMEPDSKEKSLFVTSKGCYQFYVMPFVLQNTPSTFQRLLNTILGHLISHECLAYVEDILVLGKLFEEHLRNFQVLTEKIQLEAEAQ